MKNIKNISAVKFGNVVNISLDGKLHKKNCGSPKEADELFKLVLKAKDDPSEANIKTILCSLNEKLRVAMQAGLECDPESGEVFLAGFNTPIPIALVEVIREYHENNYPLEAIINFWKLLMINPDKRVRTTLFDFIKVHDFVLTDAGYMLVYKAVDRADVNNKEAQLFEEYVSNQVLHVKKDWKCSPNKYVVFKNADGEYGITKTETAEGWDEDDKAVEVLGNLGELYKAIIEAPDRIGNDSATVYLSKYSNAPKMEIRLGVPVVMPRAECNGDPRVECSFGLHVGSTSYIQQWYSNSNTAVLVALVSPANVIAVPIADATKIRVSEYYPIGVATYTDGKIDIVEQKYFDDNYISYEIDELDKQIAKVKAEELPLEVTLNAEAESRPMSELLRILSTRLIDIE